MATVPEPKSLLRAMIGVVSLFGSLVVIPDRIRAARGRLRKAACLRTLARPLGVLIARRRPAGPRHRTAHLGDERALRYPALGVGPSRQRAASQSSVSCTAPLAARHVVQGVHHEQDDVHSVQRRLVAATSAPSGSSSSNSIVERRDRPGRDRPCGPTGRRRRRVEAPDLHPEAHRPAGPRAQLQPIVPDQSRPQGNARRRIGPRVCRRPADTVHSMVAPPPAAAPRSQRAGRTRRCLGAPRFGGDRGRVA